MVSESEWEIKGWWCCFEKSGQALVMIITRHTPSPAIALREITFRSKLQFKAPISCFIQAITSTLPRQQYRNKMVAGLKNNCYYHTCSGHIALCNVGCSACGVLDTSPTKKFRQAFIGIQEPSTIHKNTQLFVMRQINKLKRLFLHTATPVFSLLVSFILHNPVSTNISQVRNCSNTLAP